MKKAEIIQFATKFREGILGGLSSDWMCYAICGPLASILNLNGANVTLVNGELDLDDHAVAHFWLELSDGEILDPTADQFVNPHSGEKMPPVYVGEKPAWYFTADEMEFRDEGV